MMKDVSYFIYFFDDAGHLSISYLLVSNLTVESVNYQGTVPSLVG
jgi:hypothetical protein